MVLEVKTLFAVIALITTVTGIALFFYGENNKTYPGFNHWIIGTLAAACGYVATLVRGPVPVWVSILAANGLFVLAGLFRLDGVMRFFQGKSLNRLFYVSPVVAGLVAGYYYFAVDSMIVRVAFLTVWVCLLTWAIAAVFFRCASLGSRSLNYATGVIHVMYGLVMLARTTLWARQSSYGLFDGTGYNTLFFTSVIVYEIWLGLIIMMMNNQRMASEITLQSNELAGSLARLEKTMSEVKVLKGLLPICASCKKIRDDKGYWNQLESYIDAHSEARFSHGICPGCAARMLEEINGTQT